MIACLLAEEEERNKKETWHVDTLHSQEEIATWRISYLNDDVKFFQHVPIMPKNDGASVQQRHASD